MTVILDAAGRMMWESENSTGTGPAHTSQVISATGQKIAGVFRAPKTGNIDSIAFQCLSLSGTPSLYVRLESCDGSWKPSGTIIAAGATATGTPSVGANRLYFTTPYAATANELLAAVIGYSSGATSATIAVRATGPYQRFLPGMCLDSNGGGWAVLSAVRPAIVPVYDDNNYGMIAHMAGDGISYSFGTASSPNEVGNIITPLFTYECVGANITVRDNGTASSDICLYDSGGTLLRSYSHTPSSSPSTNPLMFTIYWEPVTFTAGETYYLTVKAVSGTCSTSKMTYNSANARKAVTYEAWGATRTSGGAWTESTEVLYGLVPLVTDITATGMSGFPLSRTVN
jgi:hypothetical protein